MKNLHILPTEEESRLQVNKHKKMFLSQEPKAYLACINQNIYITSEEEIKEGDWVVAKDGIWKDTITKITGTAITDVWKKIILTTDQDLIKDGVQAIDDEFLEWFVKNPSCEEVVVIYEPKNFFDVKKGWEYKIIIPKEEPNIIDQWLEKNGNPEITKQVDEEAKKLQKQHLIDIMKQDEELGLYEQTKCYCGHTTTCDCGPEQEILLEDIFNDEKRQGVKELIDKHKQETLEEAKNNALNNYEHVEGNLYSTSFKNGFEIGVKWQQEISYSEEEVLYLLYKLWEANPRNIKEWFEQFKKK
jgi:hypothetical protein